MTYFVLMDGDPWDEDAWVDGPESRSTSVQNTRPITDSGEDRKRAWVTMLAFCALFAAAGAYAVSRHGPIDIGFAVFFFAVAAYAVFLVIRSAVRRKG